MSKQEALNSPKIYELWRFAETNLNFVDWVNMVYVEYDKIKVNVYA